MPFELFGFSIGRTGKVSPPKAETSIPPIDPPSKSFAPKEEQDGALTLNAAPYGGIQQTYVDIDGSVRDTAEMIKKYREMALYPECENAISDICDESIVFEPHQPVVEIDFEDDQVISKKIQGMIKDEFKTVLHLLKFNEKGYEHFRNWYIDGRIFFHKIIDPNPAKAKEGIQELRKIDAMRMRKVRNVRKKKDEKTGVITIDKVEEFFVYTEVNDSPQSPVQPTVIAGMQGTKIAPDAITYVPSGLFDATKKRVVSYLHPAIRTLNQLRMLEDAVVVYRFIRATERRIFYLDTGNLPKNRADQYVRETMNRFRTKMLYDQNTGEYKDDRRFMSMLEDFWLPRREGGKGTEIQTLPGGQQLGKMEDVEYFQKKLYDALHVPTSRMQADNGFNMGREAEIGRDELKFSKFIDRLRKKFAELFLDILKTQLVLKGIIVPEDWELFKETIVFNFRQDAFFTEQKETQLMEVRLDLMTKADAFLGKYFGKQYIQRDLLRMSDREIKEQDKELQKDMADMAAQGIDPMSTSYSIKNAGPTVLPPMPQNPPPLMLPPAPPAPPKPPAKKAGAKKKAKKAKK